ncbi:MAG: PHP domain-containing protein [Candidatus Rokubacteria bacterium]|nr:PHP domain-containing protein [Candidatus Rokubacteria bacterium]
MTSGVDLHSHTTASDGALEPRELVQEAARRGVRVLAITDHDSTEALAEAFDEVAKHPPMTLVPGIEINCDVDGGEVHILGYFLEYQTAWFQAFLREQRAERRDRVYRIAARLAELGMPIDPAEVFALVKEGSAGRPHIAQVLVSRGYVKSFREAFDRYLRAGGPANVARKQLAPAQAVDIIRRVGGVPVLAHPGLAGRDDIIPDLVRAGLMGIECYYHEHSAAQTRIYLQMCTDLGLVATGGSDFHGLHIGRTNPLGSPSVPLSAYEALRAKAQEARAARPI